MWYARSAKFLQTPVLGGFRWLRSNGDTVFALGILAFGWFLVGLSTGWSILGKRRDASLESVAPSVTDPPLPGRHCGTSSTELPLRSETNGSLYN